MFFIGRGRTKSWTFRAPKGAGNVCKKEQREKALALYDKCHSVTKVIQVLGYPESRQGLYPWLRQRNAAPKKKAERRRVNNSPDYPLHPSLKTKLDILRRCFIEGENVQLVSEETGYSRASILYMALKIPIRRTGKTNEFQR